MCAENERIDIVFYFFKLLFCKSRKMRKVKSDGVLVYKLTCLLNVRAEIFSERSLKKVCRRVVSCDSGAALCVDLCTHFVAE